MTLTLKRVVRRAARKVLVSLENLDECDDAQDTEVVFIAPWKVTVQARRIAGGPRQLESATTSAAKPEWIPSDQWAALHEVERNAVLAATDKPVPLKVLAKLAGYAVTSYFRTAVTNLVRQGFLRRTADGLSQTKTP